MKDEGEQDTTKSSAEEVSHWHTQILLLDQGRSIKPKLDTGVKVLDNEVKKKQRHTTNQEGNMYINIFNKSS